MSTNWLSTICGSTVPRVAPADHRALQSVPASSLLTNGPGPPLGREPRRTMVLPRFYTKLLMFLRQELRGPRMLGGVRGCRGSAGLFPRWLPSCQRGALRALQGFPHRQTPFPCVKMLLLSPQEPRPSKRIIFPRYLCPIRKVQVKVSPLSRGCICTGFLDFTDQ